MYQIGRLCVKLAGRDSNKKCVVVDVIDDNFVLIDGQTRRRKCNIIHLEPLDGLVKIKKNASHDDVLKELKKLKVEVSDKKVKRNKKSENKDKKVVKKEVKKEEIKKKETKPIKLNKK